MVDLLAIRVRILHYYFLHIFGVFRESTVAMAMADVMMYDDATKQWLSPDGSSEAARSQVRILHNVHTNAFRIVGTRLQVRFRLIFFL